MIRFLSLVLFCIISGFATAQEVQWASKVIEFSSELSPLQYSAKQALNKPNVLPNGGENPNAWTPKNPNRIEFIKVGFDRSQKIQQIAIGESYNPGSISSIYVYDSNGNETQVYTFNSRPLGEAGRLLNVFFDMTSFNVVAVKLEIDGRAVPGYNSIDAIGISDSEVPIKVENLIKLADNISEDLEAQRLGPQVNSEVNEFRPLISPDGKTLFFSRSNHPGNVGGTADDEDIWYSELDETTGEWKEARNIGPVLNNKGPNYISSITPDGNTVVLLLGNEYLPNGKMKAGVSVSRKTEAGWTEPEPLAIDNLYNYSEKANFYMANNRKTLLMSIEREDSYGDRDLYASFLNDDGQWSEPLNLGNTLNTASEESAPFLAADDETLYFSSDGYAGFGGTDIFVTRRLDDTWKNWTEPENLGPDINSENDDEFFNIPASGEYAYYSRGVGTENLDIFKLELPVFYQPAPVVLVQGTVYNSKTNEPLGNVKILYERLPDGTEVGLATSDPQSGAYKIILPSGAKYGYLAEADGYVAVNANMDLNDLEEYKEISQDLFLVPVEAGATITLNNIFFDFDRSTLKDDSYPELTRLIEFMNNNSGVEVEIAGHTDSIGSEPYNQRLSERRAKAVYDHLVKNGIAPERVVSRGFGESKPVADNINKEGRSQNRRVEFKILSE
ncbi:MAG: OmpA family protein [Cyclobacteriaceae bacterium]|nr:OmpA family protein [Cyclobacteriaceae bacterium]